MARGSTIVRGATAVAAAVLLAAGAASCALRQPRLALPAIALPELQAEALAGRMSRTVRNLVETLDSHPDLLPPEPLDTTPVVMVLFDYHEDRTESFVGPFPLPGADLAYERLRAARRTAPADGWIVITDATGERPIYWSPIVMPGTIRTEIPGGEEGEPIEASFTDNPSRHVPIRLPFHRGALVVFYSTEQQRPIRPTDIHEFRGPPPRLVGRQAR